MAVKGARFQSKHAGFRLLIQPHYVKRWHPTTGQPLEAVNDYWAEFGRFGPQTTMVSPEDGKTYEVADIQGFVYDTTAEAERHNWTDDFHELALIRLREQAQREPSVMWEIEQPKVVAELPWPTYNDLDADEIVKLAPVLGKVDAVLAYEAENLGRPHILDTLRNIKTAVVPDDEDDLEEPAAVKVEPSEPVAAGSRTITV